MNNSNRKLSIGAFWSFSGQIGYISIGLLGNIVLARLLDPKEIGIVGIAMFFISISNVLVDSGIGGALVRKPNVTNEDYSTMFLFNLAISVVLFFTVVCTAGWIADFYLTSDLKPVLITLATTLIINAFTLIHNVRLTREMDFRRISYFRISAIGIGTIIAIAMANAGYGIWSMVTLQIITPLLLTAMHWVKERPVKTLVFRKSSLKEMLSFGVFTTMSSLMITIFENIYQLIIGKYFTLNQAGFYYQAKRFQDVIDSPVKSVLYGTIYSHLSKLQSDKNAFKASHNNISKLFAIALGMITNLAVVYSDDIVLLFYGEKWLACSFYLKLLCLASYFNILEILHSNLFRVFNQTHKMFYLEILKKIVQVASIGIGIYLQSISVLLIGWIITSIIGYAINVYYSRKTIDENGIKPVQDFLKTTLAASLTIGVSLSFFYQFETISFILKILFFMPFCLMYLILLYILRVENIFTIFSRYKTII